MKQPNALSPLLMMLAGLYAAENRPGALQAAEALIDAAVTPRSLRKQANGPLDAIFHETLDTSQHPASAVIRAAAPYLPWVFSALGGRIRDEIARGMMQSDLIGPEGLFENHTVTVGLFVQSAGLNYVTRSHAAEETFIILGGHGLWTMGNDAPRDEGPGAYIHHPSFMPHASQTAKMPLLAAWRWSGDISVEQYALKG
jgi:hypothetical protein